MADGYAEPDFTDWDRFSGIDALFREVDRKRDVKRASDEFDFDVDRSRGRVIDLIDYARLDPSATRVTVRVQTARSFSADCGVVLTELTAAASKRIGCVLRMSGFVPKGEAPARTFLEAALRRRTVAAAAHRIVDEEIERQGLAIGGRWLATMGDAGQRASVEVSLAAALRTGGFPVDKVTLEPIHPDRRDYLDVEDPDRIEVRCRGSLEKRSVRIKARLRWGNAPGQAAARFSYRPRNGASDRGGALESDPFTRALTAKLRQLVPAALGRYGWEDIEKAERRIIDAIAAEVSQELGKETGRIIDSLVLLPIVGPSPGTSKQLKFPQSYTIKGLSKGTLLVEHNVSYRRHDNDLWRAQGSPDPELLLKSNIRDAMEHFLQNRPYAAVVQLYLDAADGEAEINRRIEEFVWPVATAVGYQIASVSTVLSIPEVRFVKGARIESPTFEFGLAEGFISAPIKITTDVKIGSAPGDGVRFSQVTNLEQPLDTQIRDMVQAVVGKILRGCEAFTYYTSRYANGKDIPAQDDLRGQSLSSTINAEVRAELGRQFGLELVRLDLQPVDDPFVNRMRLLMSRSVNQTIDQVIPRGRSGAEVRLIGQASIFIESIDPDNWNSFYPQVLNRTLSEHESDIRDRLDFAIAGLTAILDRVNFRDVDRRQLSDAVRAQVVDTIRRVCGLRTRLALQLRVDRSASLSVRQLQLKLLTEQYAAAQAALHTLISRSADDVNGFNSARITKMHVDQRTLIDEIKSVADQLESEEQANADSIVISEDAPRILGGGAAGTDAAPDAAANALSSSSS